MAELASMLDAALPTLAPVSVEQYVTMFERLFRACGSLVRAVTYAIVGVLWLAGICCRTDDSRPLLLGLRSHMTPEQVQRCEAVASVGWSVLPRDNRIRKDFTARIMQIRDLGMRGEAYLHFWDQRLVEVEFIPEEPDPYMKSLGEILGKALRPESRLQISDGVELQIMDVLVTPEGTRIPLKFRDHAWFPDVPQATGRRSFVATDTGLRAIEIQSQSD